MGDGREKCHRMNNKGHEFSFFVPTLTTTQGQQEAITISDSALVHRLSHVVRLEPGETVVLFDDIHNASYELLRYAKGSAVLNIKGVLQKNIPVLPKLTVILPLLKRDALDEVVYACRELGASSVVFVATEKTSRQNLSPSEWERLERVSIAAAEQSKNFYPCSFNEKRMIPTLAAFLGAQEGTPTFMSAQKWYADPSGISWQEGSKEKKSSEFFICVGPEGDLVDREKELLREGGFIFCTLGSTILRAQQAAVVLLGLVRAGL